MASLNQVTLLGNCTRDPDLRKTAGGKSVCSFGLAVNDRYKNDHGEWVDKPMFIDIVCWGRTAEVATEFLAKGNPVLIAGELQLERWEKDGVKHSKHSVVCNRLQLVGGRTQGDSTTQERPPAKREESQEVEEPIPF